MDLEAELARFEAELAAVEQPPPQSSHPAPAPSSSTPQAPPPVTTHLPPPSRPPPGFPSHPQAPPHAPHVPHAPIPPPAHPPPVSHALPQHPQHNGTIPPPMMPPPSLPPPAGPPPVRAPPVGPPPVGPPPMYPPPGVGPAAPSQPPQPQGPQTMYYAPPQINPQLLVDDPTPEEQTEEERLKLREIMMKASEQDKKKQATGIKRKAAGKTWWDPTLSEWPPNDFRIFVGDLGNEVNDDILGKAFQKYPSFAKAKVVRDKHSNKSKGYGFVSFIDGTDFAKAMKEMNGKYIGNRPCKLRKSEWTERNAPQPKKKGKKK